MAGGRWVWVWAAAALWGCDDGGTAESPDPDAARPRFDQGGPADASARRDQAVDGPIDAGPTPDADAVTPDADPADDAGSADGAPDAEPADVGPDAARFFEPPRLAAVAACAVAEEDRCALSEARAPLSATYRKDHFLPDERYPEYTDPPVTGGRVQIAAVAAIGGFVTSVRVDGIELATIEDPPVEGETPPFEWWHVWPSVLAPGEPVWVAFHSRDARWDDGTPGTVVVETSEGVAVDGAFPVAPAAAPLSYVTTADAGRTLLIHARADAAFDVERVWVNGRDVTGVACLAERALEPGGTALWIVPLCEPLAPGDAWTVTVEAASGASATGVGRVLPERFPIEAWNNTSDCPFPGADEGAFARHRAAGIDTLYFHEGTCPECGCANPVVTAAVAATEDVRLLATWGAVIPGDRPAVDPAALAGIATGDESDGELYDGQGRPQAARRALLSRQAWARHPHLPTFNGAKTNGHVGTFAGMADVQGIDLYVAACAPHVTEPLHAPAPRAAFDYLRNARDNHRPLPTWLYAQGLSPAWNREARGELLHWQPDVGEILVQAYSVMAAGGKGLLWFQSNLEEATRFPERWAAMVGTNLTYRALRPWLREGDVGALVVTDAGTLAEVVRARDALVLVVVNTVADRGPDDLECIRAHGEGEAEPPHWIFADRAPQVVVRVPDDLAIADGFELVDGDVRGLTVPVNVAGRRLTLPAVPLTARRPARVFVFAADADVRAAIAATPRPPR